ncbi:MAG TPA: radical SAM protein [Tepidisphaeraceae bacterium]|nr:radical SAM protein [Tepidisphaeraceae bacterium]
MPLPIISESHALWEKSWRYRRHLESFFKYPSLRRIANLAVVEGEYLLRRQKLHGFPYVMIIEPNNTCNLRCPFCPTTLGELAQPDGMMPLEQFKRLMDQIAPYTFRVILYNWGEPFLHKDIIPMIEYAHSKRIGLIVSSNLNALPRQGVEALVASGLDQIIVSCDGLSQESYEKYRRNGKLAKVVENLKLIHETKKRLGRSRPKVELQFLAFKHNEHEIPGVPEFGRQVGADHVSILNPRFDYPSEEILPASNPAYVRPGYAPGEREHEPLRKRADKTLLPIPCSWPWRSMIVNWNGTVDPCCYNNKQLSFGNVHEQPIRKIWNDSPYRAARQRIKGSRDYRQPHGTICDTCRGFK